MDELLSTSVHNGEGGKKPKTQLREKRVGRLGISITRKSLRRIRMAPLRAGVCLNHSATGTKRSIHSLDNSSDFIHDVSPHQPHAKHVAGTATLSRR
jgi:hypothetical protein